MASFQTFLQEFIVNGAVTPDKRKENIVPSGYIVVSCVFSRRNINSLECMISDAYLNKRNVIMVNKYFYAYFMNMQH